MTPEDRLHLRILLRPALWPGALRRSEDLVGALLAVLVGAVAGVGAVAFRGLLSAASDGFSTYGARLFTVLGEHHAVVLPAIGGALVGGLLYVLARGTRGPGVPDVMAAVALEGGRIRPRIALVRSVASLLTIASGGSAGIVGPIVGIGSASGSWVGQRLHLPSDWVKTLVACGAAGGVSATFNTPIAGVFFGLEVILRRYNVRSLGLVVLSSVVAAIVAYAVLGERIPFEVPNYHLSSGWEVPLYLLLGVLSAVVAIGFSTALYAVESLFLAARLPEYVRPALGGLGVGAIGIFYPQVFGGGFEVMGSALVGEMTMGLLAVLLVLKLAATSLTLGSGGAGGVFAPSLFLGAMLGGAFGHGAAQVFPGMTSPVGAYAVVGMAAVFSGAARAPITAIIIVFEMTREYELILPLMTAVIVSTITARILRRDTIYTAKLRRRGVILPEEEEADVLGRVPVSRVMQRQFPTALASASVESLVDLFARNNQTGFPVVDEEGRLTGVVTLSDLERAPRDGTATVGDIATKRPVVAFPDQSVHEAMKQLGGYEVGRLPVVSRDEPTRLVGVLRRNDIVRAYAQAVANVPNRQEDLAHGVGDA
jgi:CIC family chloride channel protein